MTQGTRVLKDDKRTIFTAGAAASAATDFIKAFSQTWVEYMAAWNSFWPGPQGWGNHLNVPPI